MEVDASRSADPRRVADVALAAAIRAQVESVFIEPTANEDGYAITFDRDGAVLTTVTIDSALGCAVIARLAFLAGLDLAASHPTSGLVPARSGSREADVMITMRPGAQLRAELAILGRQRKREPITAVGPVVGDVIGQYKVLAFRGEGGMGTVFSVEQVVLGRTYALKVLRTKVIERDPSAAQKFLREARTAARIRHPNIVDVFDFGYLPDGRPYFVMELLEGESLADRVARGPLPIADVVTIARQLATALCAAHERGVVHADVTPSNVLVVGDEVKLVDFGLAELSSEGMGDEMAEFIFGTPAYISPEQLRGLSPTDRSDQYSLGAVLFELISGRPPYVGSDLRALCMMHLDAPIPAVESPHGPLPPSLTHLVTTCLQKTPQARFPGMRAVLAALDQIEKVTERRGWRRWLAT